MHTYHARLDSASEHLCLYFFSIFLWSVCGIIWYEDEQRRCFLSDIYDTDEDRNGALGAFSPGCRYTLNGRKA
jgi:hypothetical protein